MTEKDTYSVTTRMTDEEAGSEGLDEVSAAKRELKALEIMKSRGLIPDHEFENRQQELMAIIQLKTV